MSRLPCRKNAILMVVRRMKFNDCILSTDFRLRATLRDPYTANSGLTYGGSAVGGRFALFLDDAQLEVGQLEQPDRRHQTQQVEEHARTEPPQQTHGTFHTRTSHIQTSSNYRPCKDNCAKLRSFT